MKTGRLVGSDGQTLFSDRPYIYSLSGSVGGGEDVTSEIRSPEYTYKEGSVVVNGRFAALPIELTQRFDLSESCIKETISLHNDSEEVVELSDIGIGFSANLGGRRDWRLCAIPFKVQLDGSRHDYSTSQLIGGEYHNAVYSDSTRPEPDLIEEQRLRSEAWAWWSGDRGIAIIKYNNRDLEMSVAAPVIRNNENTLRFGGVGSSLYREPLSGHRLAPDESFTFGPTWYFSLEGSIDVAFECYRSFLDERGHRFPSDYNPPVNWNELYDIGWYHSDRESLVSSYTRTALLAEAEKAKECGCEMLYLDPGWEFAEGTTIWDEERLGSVSDFVTVLKNDYGLDLGMRTILRCYRDHWPDRYLVDREGFDKGAIKWADQNMWELCLCDDSFRAEKIERIHTIVNQGVRFLMVDEMDWRGPCVDVENHSHRTATCAGDHASAVYDLCDELRARNPQLRIECHDPVWPWHTAIYVPSYYRHGFGGDGSYDENWGFEYMWDCINDLTSGKALALYYYNIACNIPLYLHITMASDNDSCLFFWWAASTIRHLGIGGMSGHPTVNPGDLPAHDPEKRFAAYREQMSLYRRLKPYFVRGRFVGISETAHLHVLPEKEGGVLVLFNLSEETRVFDATVSEEQLYGERVDRVANSGSELPMVCESPQLIPTAALVEHSVYEGSHHISVEIAALSPAIITFGDASR